MAFRVEVAPKVEAAGSVVGTAGLGGRGCSGAVQNGREAPGRTSYKRLASCVGRIKNRLSRSRDINLYSSADVWASCASTRHQVHRPCGPRAVHGAVSLLMACPVLTCLQLQVKSCPESVRRRSFVGAISRKIALHFVLRTSEAHGCRPSGLLARDEELPTVIVWRFHRTYRSIGTTRTDSVPRAGCCRPCSRRLTAAAYFPLCNAAASSKHTALALCRGSATAVNGSDGGGNDRARPVSRSDRLCLQLWRLTGPTTHQKLRIITAGPSRACCRCSATRNNFLLQSVSHESIYIGVGIEAYKRGAAHCIATNSKLERLSNGP